MLALPLSVVGGVAAAPLAGGLWSVGSLAGLFAVLALAIRASVLLGYRIRTGLEAGATARGAVLDAARERAVPLLGSALITAVVVVPAALLGARAGLEFLHPLAVTMLGGLVSLLLTQAIVLPALLAAEAGRPDPGQPAARPGAQPATEPGAEPAAEAAPAR